MEGQIYSCALQLNKTNTFDTEASFLIWDLSKTNGIVSSKIHDELDDFSFEIVDFAFLSGDDPRSFSMAYVFNSLFVLWGYVLIVVTSAIETNFWLLC